MNGKIPKSENYVAENFYYATISHHITPHHITPHHITPHHITSHHITPHRTTSQPSAAQLMPSKFNLVFHLCSHRAVVELLCQTPQGETYITTAQICIGARDLSKIMLHLTNKVQLRQGDGQFAEIEKSTEVMVDRVQLDNGDMQWVGSLHHAQVWLLC